MADSELLNENNCMCCLGFACLAMGVTWSDIEGVTVPSCLPDWTFEYVPLFVSLSAESKPTSSKLSKDLIKINDDKSTTDAYKEQEITCLFAEVGITVKWED